MHDSLLLEIHIRTYLEDSLKSHQPSTSDKKDQKKSINKNFYKQKNLLENHQALLPHVEICEEAYLKKKNL